MVLDYIRELGPWSWWIVGLLLLALEIAVPGNVFVWMGIAAILTGGLALFTELGWQAELIVFGVLSLVLVIAGRSFFARKSEAGDDPLLNQRANRLIGRSYILAEPIVDGLGRIKVDDANWRISGPNLPSGTRVKVVSFDGSVLTVAAEA